MLAYHFQNENMKSNGERKPWKIGETRRMKKSVVKMCVRGYHSSPTPADAAFYGGSRYWLTLVDVSFPVTDEGDKFVSARRTLLARVKVSSLMAEIQKELKTKEFYFSVRQFAHKNRTIFNEIAIRMLEEERNKNEN